MTNNQKPNPAGMTGMKQCEIGKETRMVIKRTTDGESFIEGWYEHETLSGKPKSTYFVITLTEIDIEEMKRVLGVE